LRSSSTRYEHSAGDERPYCRGVPALIVAAAAQAVGAYAILYLGVAASWIGIPIVRAGALAAAGVLASEGDLNIWLVIVVAIVAAWTGGYVGYWLGLRGRSAVLRSEGPWQRQRRRTMLAGERLYRRWGRLAVVVTPTWVSGAMRISRNTFLRWNALAPIVSTCIAALGAYGVGAALLGQLSAKRGALALAVAPITAGAAGIAVRRRRGGTDPEPGSRSDARPKGRVTGCEAWMASGVASGPISPTALPAAPRTRAGGDRGHVRIRRCRAEAERSVI
jgi:membrane protein DedA with SNARE-associated domain